MALPTLADCGDSPYYRKAVVSKLGEFKEAYVPNEEYGNPERSLSNGSFVGRNVQRLGIEDSLPITSLLAPSTLLGDEIVLANGNIGLIRSSELILSPALIKGAIQG